jgi:carboxyl-terminal processing protease
MLDNNTNTPYTPPSKYSKKEECLNGRNRSLIVQGIIFTLGILLLGVVIGYSQNNFIDKFAYALNIKQNDESTVDLNNFWKVWNLLDEKYPSANKISKEDRIYGAIKGLVSSMEDPYTTFFTPVESKIFQEDVLGSFSGIGVEIGVKDGLLVVISPLKDSPAQKAGIKKGDIIFKIDDKVVSEMTVDETIGYIRGEKGTNVLITILRKDEKEPIVMSIKRDVINVPTIDEKIIDNSYLIKLYNFNATSAESFHKALINMKQSGLKNLIIDLRGNTGGYLDSAISISSEFLPEGDTVVTEDYGNDKKNIHRSYGFRTISEDYKILVLIDSGSASASEILAGALKDNKRATVIGENSFGKGSVQELIDLKDDTSIKITIANWLTPNGSIIEKKGIIPDIEVKESEDYNKDLVLEKALDFIKNNY